MKRNLIIIVIITVFLLLIIASCSSHTEIKTGSIQYKTMNSQWSNKIPKTPEWVNKRGIKGNKMIFVGLSNEMTSEKLSEEDALNDLSAKITQYILTKVKKKVDYVSYYEGSAGDIIEPQLADMIKVKIDIAEDISGVYATEVFYLLKRKSINGIDWGKESCKAYIKQEYSAKQLEAIRNMWFNKMLTSIEEEIKDINNKNRAKSLGKLEEKIKEQINIPFDQF